MIIRGIDFKFDRPYIMGILNITPDSFSDGGEYMDPETAAARVSVMVSQGADILDIGGESTKPGAAKVSAAEESARIMPVIRAVRTRGINIPISVDTYKSSVAGAALAEGADIINDISGGTFDPDILKCTAESGAVFIIMHIKGIPENMQRDTVYPKHGITMELSEYFRQRILAAEAAGIRPENIIIDPGIGFGKTLEQNLELLEAIPEFRKFGKPVLIGTSRKSMIGSLLNRQDPKQRLFGTAATVAISIARGADIVRVHDVAEMKDVATVAGALAGFASKRMVEKHA
jgi:dihydropteroate synthase